MSHDYYCWFFPERNRDRRATFELAGSVLARHQARPLSMMQGPPDYDSVDLSIEGGAPDDSTELVAYALHGLEVTFWLHNLRNGAPLQIPVLTVAEFAIAPGRETFSSALFRIIDDLHLELGSRRTVLGWELGELGDFDPAAEYDALDRAVVNNLYWLDITARGLVDEERLAFLEDYARRKRSCSLTRLANGDFRLQHSLVDLAGY